MLDAVKQTIVDIYWNDQMCQENLGSRNYNSESCYDKISPDTHKKIRYGKDITDNEANDIANCTSFSQAFKTWDEELSDDFIKEFAEYFCWSELRKHQFIPLELLIEFKEQINTTHFLEQGWIKKEDLIHFDETNDNYLLRKGIFNKFDILEIK